MSEQIECKFCNVPFKSNKWLEKHKCKRKVRFEESQTIRGQSAWKLYVDWFKSRNMTAPGHEKFLTSKYYNAFMLISDFIKEKQINDYKHYIEFMVKKGNQPSMWVNIKMFSEYLQSCSVNIEPMEQLSITIDWLDKYAGENECSIKDIIDRLEPYQIMDGMRTAKFLPWYFLNSPKFYKKISQFTPIMKNEFASIIDMAYWKFSFDKNKELRKEIRTIIKQVET